MIIVAVVAGFQSYITWQCFEMGGGGNRVAISDSIQANLRPLFVSSMIILLQLMFIFFIVSPS